MFLTLESNKSNTNSREFFAKNLSKGYKRALLAESSSCKEEGGRAFQIEQLCDVKR